MPTELIEEHIVGAFVAGGSTGFAAKQKKTSTDEAKGFS